MGSEASIQSCEGSVTTCSVSVREKVVKPRSEAAEPSPGLVLIEVVRRSAAFLASAGVTTPRLEAELLVGHVLTISRLDLYLQFARSLSQAELSSLRSLIRRRALGCPLAYLLGEKEFFGLSFVVSEAVLIPRPETELLVELAIERAAKLGKRVQALDAGAGSGCLGIALAHRLPDSRIDAVDAAEGAVAVASLNVERHGLADRVQVHRGSWVVPEPECGPYQLILSNPPYLTSAEWCGLDRSVRDFEPRVALDGGEDGLACYRELIGAVAPVTADDATLLLECDPYRISAVEQICRQRWPRAHLQVHPDLSARARVLEVRLS